MEKIIKVKAKGCSIHHNGEQYKVGNEFEIEERFFRDDCMEKIETLKLGEQSSSDENGDDLKDVQIKVTELKEIAEKHEIKLEEKLKDKIVEELRVKLEEKGINLDEEITLFEEKKNENS